MSAGSVYPACRECRRKEVKLAGDTQYCGSCLGRLWKKTTADLEAMTKRAQATRVALEEAIERSTVAATAKQRAARNKKRAEELEAALRGVLSFGTSEALEAAHALLANIDGAPESDRSRIFRAFGDERLRQQQKFPGRDIGQPTVTDGTKLRILVEEIGEVAEAMDQEANTKRELEAELTQVGACALAWLESIALERRREQAMAEAKVLAPEESEKAWAAAQRALDVIASVGPPPKTEP